MNQDFTLSLNQFVADCQVLIDTYWQNMGYYRQKIVNLTTNQAAGIV